MAKRVLGVVLIYILKNTLPCQPFWSNYHVPDQWKMVNKFSANTKKKLLSHRAGDTEWSVVTVSFAGSMWARGGQA